MTQKKDFYSHASMYFIQMESILVQKLAHQMCHKNQCFTRVNGNNLSNINISHTTKFREQHPIFANILRG